MAFESCYWKRQARGDIRMILKRLEVNVSNLDDRKSDKIFSEVEIKLFTVAYSLRKLMDTRKLPDKVGTLMVHLLSFPRNKKTPMTPWSFFDDYYYFDAPEKVNMSLRDVCNSFIHAYFFQPSASSRGRLIDLYFTSDHDRNKCLYLINLKRFLKILEIAFDQDVTHASFEYVPGTGKYVSILR